VQRPRLGWLDHYLARAVVMANCHPVTTLCISMCLHPYLRVHAGDHLTTAEVGCRARRRTSASGGWAPRRATPGGFIGTAIKDLPSRAGRYTRPHRQIEPPRQCLTDRWLNKAIRRLCRPCVQGSHHEQPSDKHETHADSISASA
jgi:hypothetical protein